MNSSQVTGDQFHHQREINNYGYHKIIEVSKQKPFWDQVEGTSLTLYRD